MVSLPERRRSSSPLARPRFSSAAGTFSGTLLTNFGPVGRPASNGERGTSVYFRDPDENLIELLTVD